MKMMVATIMVLVALALTDCKTSEFKGEEYDADRLPKHLKVLQD